MVKIARHTKSSKPRPSAHKANVVGYANRQSRKAKSLKNLSDDIYEYQPEKVRRSKVTLDLGRDEAAEFGGDGDDSGREELGARLIGEYGDDEKIDSDDDEEIDSDIAFEESDEERFAGFNFSQKRKRVTTKKANVRFAEVDLNENDDEIREDAGGPSMEENADEEEEMEEDGESDEFIDVLDVLDGKGEVDHGSDVEAENRKGDSRAREVEVQDGEDTGEKEDEEKDTESEKDEEMVLSASDADEIVPDALEELGNFISKLDPGKKRKAQPDEDTNTQADNQRVRKRRMLKERTEGGAENEFSARVSGVIIIGSKLNLDDLLGPLASQSSNLLSLKRSTKVLASSSAIALSAPLPQRTQERLDREAAYEQTKQEVDKWSATMRRIKDAEHLNFPLQAQPSGKVSNLELTAKFKPTTELESTIDKLLKSAKMREEDIHRTEELKMNHLSVEEVAARRGELRKMRELMFRAEFKAKRVAKIKSKTYRRIKKKEREKMAKALGDDVEDEDDETVRLKREVERARERATLRHKNTGKWAKAMKAKGELDMDERREISDMLERGEMLRRRIRGQKGSDDEEEDSDDDSDEEGGADRISRIKAGAFEELEKVNASDSNRELEEDGNRKSIFEMKFMKDAMDREQQKADHMVDDFIKEMGGTHDADTDTEEVADEGDVQSGHVAVERMGGRVVYRPGDIAGAPSAQTVNSLPSDASSVTLKSTVFVPTSPPEASQPVEHPHTSPSKESNPWLVSRDYTLKAPKKKNELIVNKDSSAIEKSKNKFKKQSKKREEERDKAKEDAVVEISVDEFMKLDVPAASNIKPKGVSKKLEASSKVANDASDDDSDVNSEVEEQEKILDPKLKGKANNGVKAFEQRDLVALAFAGDNVVEAFQEAKRREIADDAPKEVDTTLPGWGAWGGSGTRKRQPKSHLIKKIAGVDPSSRADFNKSHVIISEKRDKKAAKYLVKDLPYPYTSKVQFERGMETPLGTEWNTRVGFQRGTLPKVVKKMGTIIDPLEKLF